ncbi:hypothetical protein SDC9_80983 [bioreactor metagenome]|uniref:Uncharacterized protein n=1 Tax=bioreactor metagenome TaxID=1076179 RepID=A0A644Z0J4_9ZZZZ
MQPQSFTNIGRLEHSIFFVQVVTGRSKRIGHHAANVFKMHLAIIKELTLTLFVCQLTTSSQFNGVPAKRLFHAADVVNLSIRMYPFIQKEVGDISQQQRPRIVYGLKSA